MNNKQELEALREWLTNYARGCDRLGLIGKSTEVREHLATVEAMLRDEAAAKVALLKGLRELCGFFQDGSQETVKLYQDDACRSYHLEVGKHHYFHEHSWEGVITEAIRARAAEKTIPPAAKPWLTCGEPACQLYESCGWPHSCEIPFVTWPNHGSHICDRIPRRKRDST